MKIYDISQEVFGCEVYPDDPMPEKTMLRSMQKGEVYNLTAFRMCAHNGTHIDAPFHFIQDGKTVDEICLEAFVGMSYVAEHRGIVTGDDAAEITEKAKRDWQSCCDDFRKYKLCFSPAGFCICHGSRLCCGVSQSDCQHIYLQRQDMPFYKGHIYMHCLCGDTFQLCCVLCKLSRCAVLSYCLCICRFFVLRYQIFHNFP